MALAPVPTPKVLWRKPPLLAIAAVPGTALGRLGKPSTASPAAWATAGAAIRKLHDAPLPPWPGRGLDELATDLKAECEWLVTNGVLPADLVTRNRQVAEDAPRPWTPASTHGDLKITHVFIDGDEITGIIDWSEAGRGDALFDLATLTLGRPRRRRRRLWHRRRPRHDPRVVVVAKPAGSALAGRAQGFAPYAPGCGRRVELPAVRLRGPDCYECVPTHRTSQLLGAHRLPLLTLLPMSPGRAGVTVSGAGSCEVALGCQVSWCPAGAGPLRAGGPTHRLWTRSETAGARSSSTRRSTAATLARHSR
ncbi:hypothetical protein GCM10022420_099010 [Streptomyces iranensis]